jgi:hypothetical protein
VRRIAGLCQRWSNCVRFAGGLRVLIELVRAEMVEQVSMAPVFLLRVCVIVKAPRPSRYTCDCS